MFRASALFILAALVLLPAPAEAQFRILPSAGLYSPLSDLTEIRDNDGETVIEAGRKASTLALGLGAEVHAFRLQLHYATSSDVPFSGVGCESCELRSTLLTATAGILLRPFPDLVIIEPHFLIGGGVKRYGFDRDDLEDESWGEVLRNQTQPTLHLAVGSTVHLGILHPQVELGAYLSRVDGVSNSNFSSDDDFQTDLFLTVAIPIFGR